MRDEGIEKDWTAAMEADGRMVSVYGESSWGEDLSEAVVMHRLSRGSPCEWYARKMYPNRYALLDKVLDSQRSMGELVGGLVGRSVSMSAFPEHPGTIKMVDIGRKTERIKVAADVPERQRFVYLRDGNEVGKADATERVPIVRVEMMGVDAAGNLVEDPKDAATVQIVEFGEGRRPLRQTLMVPKSSGASPT